MKQHDTIDLVRTLSAISALWHDQTEERRPVRPLLALPLKGVQGLVDGTQLVMSSEEGGRSITVSTVDLSLLTELDYLQPMQRHGDGYRLHLTASGIDFGESGTESDRAVRRQRLIESIDHRQGRS
jgi:hypothetical protein